MLSIVIPIFNEELVIPELYRRLSAVIAGLAEPCEVVLIDDGSRDASVEMVKQIVSGDPRWRLVVFSRNFGHQAAVSAGIRFATGDAVVILDADLQDPPELIESFLNEWRRGSQVVYAVRTKRKEFWLKRACYHLFYRLLAQISNIDIPLDAGDFCLMDRRVVDAINAQPERVRFLRGLRAWAGFKQTGVTYERNARHAGDSKYDLRRLFRLATDGILGFSSAPLRLASVFGIAACTVSLAMIVIVAILWVLDGGIFGVPVRSVTGWCSTISLMLFLSGIQFLLIGVVGEYVGRVFEETKGRQPWVIAETLGFPRKSLPVQRIVSDDHDREAG